MNVGEGDFAVEDVVPIAKNVRILEGIFIF